jgi:acyl carrier protein
MSPETVKEGLREWLREHSRSDDLGPIPGDQDLITNRVVDSLHFVEFVLFVEEKSGNNIGTEGLDLEKFRTLDTIYDCWFQGEKA